jgi:hypothetical protein
MAAMDKSKRGLTRRRLATVALAPALLAQTPEAKPGGELELARAQVRENGERLRKFQTPMLLEPSFSFTP